MNFKNLFGLTCGFGLLAATSAFALPKASELVTPMGFGINIGNTMEAPKSPTSWGNPYPTKEYVDAIKAAGFNTVRIPCAWYTHTTDADHMVISTTWLDSVKTVVDYVINNDMYAVLNIHYDGDGVDGDASIKGWLESHIDPTVDETINKRQGEFWKQIATYFKDYDEHLLFGSANEPGMQQDDFKADSLGKERAQTLRVYHQTMADVVRQTGGNNATRTLIFQGPKTDPDQMMTFKDDFLPTDPAGSDYYMVEFHFYPYQWSLMTEDADWGNRFFYWGEGNYSATDVEHNATYNKFCATHPENGCPATQEDQFGTPAWTDTEFAKIKETFGNAPLLIGEYAAMKRREDLVGENLRLHLNSRVSWYKKVAELSKQYGMIPCAWDIGAEGMNDNTIIRRQKDPVGTILDPEVLNAMRTTYGLDPVAGSTIDSLVEWSLDDTNNMLEITYTSIQSDTSETGTMRINVGGANWSKYTSIRFQLNMNTVSHDNPTSGYGWSSLDFFAMTNDWKWSQYHIDESELSSGWNTVDIPFSQITATKASDNFNSSSVNAIGLNMYGTVLSGSIYIDNIELCNASGCVSYDDLNKKTPSTEGIASGKLITSTAPASSNTNAIKPVIATTSKMFVNVQQGFVNATFTAKGNTQAKAMLLNTMGQTIASESFMTRSGSNTVQLKAAYRGPAMLIIKQGSQMQTQKVILK